MEVQCRAHLQFTWRSSAGPISSSHGGPVQCPSPVHMEVQCRVHLQFTWRSSAGPISSSHGGPVQGPSPPSPVQMEVQCRVHLLNQVQHKLGCCQPGLHHQGTRLEGRGGPPCELEMDTALDLHVNWRWALHWTSM